MNCGVCDRPCVVIKHTFTIGVLHTVPTPEGSVWTRPPDRQAIVYAPLYFKAKPDTMEVDVPFCGPICATDYWKANP